MLKHSSQFKVIIVVKYLSYHQGLCCCTFQMVWLHSRCLLLCFHQGSPVQIPLPAPWQRRTTLWRQLHRFSFLPPQAMWHAKSSQVASLLLSASTCQLVHSSQGDVKSNDLLLQVKGENERQIQAEPSARDRWAKQTVRKQIGVKPTKILCSLSSYKTAKEKEKKMKRKKSILHHPSYKQERLNPFCSTTCTLLSWSFWVLTGRCLAATCAFNAYLHLHSVKTWDSKSQFWSESKLKDILENQQMRSGEGLNNCSFALFQCTFTKIISWCWHKPWSGCTVKPPGSKMETQQHSGALDEDWLPSIIPEVQCNLLAFLLSFVPLSYSSKNVRVCKENFRLGWSFDWTGHKISFTWHLLQ